MAVRLPGVFPEQDVYGVPTTMLNYRQGRQTPDFLSQLVTSQTAANIANQQRAAEIRAIYEENIKRYRPGGTFETKALEQIGKAGERFVEKGYGEQTQANITGGLFGTTVQAGIKPRLRKEYEEETAAPARLRLEDVLMQRLTSAQTGLAGFLERQEDVGPGLGTIGSLAEQYGAATPMSFSRTINRGDTSDSGLIDIPLPARGGTGGTVKGTGQRGVTAYDPSMVGRTSTSNIVKGYDTSGWTAAEKKAWATYVPGVSGYNVPKMKAQQRVS
jgi:hypothetical protein